MEYRSPLNCFRNGVIPCSNSSVHTHSTQSPLPPERHRLEWSHTHSVSQSKQRFLLRIRTICCFPPHRLHCWRLREHGAHSLEQDNSLQSLASCSLCPAFRTHTSLNKEKAWL